MLLVVCDATPLIYLTRLGRLGLLRQLHEAVLVPPAVGGEVAVRGSALPEGAAAQQAAKEGWLRVESPQGRLTISPTDTEDLDPGETEAIQLAIENDALLAIDEIHGRDVALKLGVKITGTVGLLARARREGLLPSLRAELDRLRTETTFRLSDSVYRDAISSVGEQAS